MSAATKIEYLDTLGVPLLGALDEITRFGFDRYHETPAHLKIEHSPRAQATCTYDHMMAEADRRFDGWDGMRLIKLRGLFVWAVEDHTLIRFKKMTAEGRGSNYRTEQTKQYDRGDQLDSLPAEAVRLTVGYYADPTATEILRVQIAHPLGKKITWCAAIIPATERVSGARIWTDVTMAPELPFNPTGTEQ